MRNKNYIICQKKKATDKDGYLLLMSKGRANKAKKSIGIKISHTQFIKYWNEKDQCFKSGVSNYKLYNDRIAAAYKELEKYDGEICEMPKDDKSFIYYWKSINKVMTNHGSRIKHETVLKKLIKYLEVKGRADLKFSEITPQFLREYQHHLATVADPKTLSTNQVTHYLKMFKSVINKKLKDNPRLYLVNPFASITFDYNADDIKRIILTKGEITKLLTGKIEDTKTDLWRDMLVFETFAAGMRVSDLMTLRWNMVMIDEQLRTGKIEYKMYKTGKTMSIPLSINLCKILMKLMGKEAFTAKEPLRRSLFPTSTENQVAAMCIEVRKFIKENDCAMDFVFPYLKNELFNNIGADNDFDRMTDEQYRKLMKAESVFNRQLKKVANALEIESSLTSHVGRHTFTQLLLNDDTKTHDITQALGHSSVKVTEHYIKNKFNKDKTDAIILKVGNNSKNAYRKEPATNLSALMEELREVKA